MHLLLAMRTTLWITLSFVVSIGRAQTVWYPPNGADLTSWIAQAAPGDILQLASGHPSFTLNKGLTLVGPSGVLVTGGGPFLQPPSIHVAVPAGQQARLVDLSLAGVSTGYAILMSQVVTSGNVSIERLTMQDGLVSLGAGSVLMQDCQLTGSFGGTAVVSIQGATCEITSSTVTGGNSTSSFQGGGAQVAVDLFGGTLVASHMVATGGSSPLSLGPGQPALRTTGGTAFLTDCTLTGGAGAAPVAGTQGSPALQAAGGVSVARTNLVSGLNVLGVSTGFQQAPQMIGLALSSAPRRGQAFTASATTSGGQLLGIVGGMVGTLNVVPAIVEPLLGQPQDLVTLVVSIPTAGVPVTANVTVPNQTALFGVGVWLQAIQLAGSEIRASAAAGGTIL